MDSPGWEPPSEAEMKLIEARRERSDKVSKLMSNYLLKGYKMLGIVCSTCETILLQDRQGNNYCVACSELDSDTEKDNPLTSHTAALSMAREMEMATGGAALEDTPKMVPCPMPSHPNLNDSHLAIGDEPERTLSMSSIDIQCWPANAEALRQPVDASAIRTAGSPDIKPDITGRGPGLSDLAPGQTNLKGSPTFNQKSQLQCESQSKTSRTVSSTTSLTRSVSGPVIDTLVDKIEWASQQLKDSQSVEYNIKLCKLIKRASQAVIAVRTARI